MIFGFNTDVQGVDGVYHVQTEDRGQRNPVVESIIYVGGKILSKKRTPYDPATSSKEQIEEAVRHQHKELTEAIKNGSWRPTALSASKADSATGVTAVEHGVGHYSIELTNPNQFHHGEYFRFQLSLRNSGGAESLGGVPLQIRWLVGGELVDQQGITSRPDGGADVWVPAPNINQSGVLLVQACGPAGNHTAKFIVSPAS
jgi:hypothetical protein